MGGGASLVVAFVMVKLLLSWEANGAASGVSMLKMFRQGLKKGTWQPLETGENHKKPRPGRRPQTQWKSRPPTVHETSRVPPGGCFRHWRFGSPRRGEQTRR